MQNVTENPSVTPFGLGMPERRRSVTGQIFADQDPRPAVDGRFVSWQYDMDDVERDDEAFDSPLRQRMARVAASLRRAERWAKRNAVWCLSGAAVAVCGTVGTLAYLEVKNSIFEANYLAEVAPHLTYKTAKGESDNVVFPTEGPYDARLGYTAIPQFVERLKRNGYTVAAQVRLSPQLRGLIDRGLYPVYQEKAIHGLRIVGSQAKVLSQETFPKVTYARLKDVPALVVSSLLFIEDRQVLDESRAPTINPAIAWGRLTRASVDMVLDKIFNDRNVPGGSTLATQIEKFRHSAEGRTRNSGDKLRQLASASTRAYQLGSDTRAYRERIVLDYINGVPLGAASGFGEVVGLGDGVEAWYGVTLDSINAALAKNPGPKDKIGRQEKALAFKRVLALFLSQRRPAYYLQQNQNDLETLTNQHVVLMAEAGLIPDDVRWDALVLPLGLLPKDHRRAQASVSFVERKAANAVRLELKKRLGIGSLYELDRLDLEVRTGYDPELQDGVTKFLSSLKTPEGATKAGLIGEHLLKASQASHVNYSFTLMEKVGDHNVVRVQTDTVNSPLDINGSSKLELGSTAKLRTLITYLDLVSELHATYKHADKAALADRLREVNPEDGISQWALTYLMDDKKDHALPAMLEAAAQRKFSASPWQAFWTGGSWMRFSNFNPDDNGLELTVAQAFQRSNNLVFVRLMKDIVQHVVMNRLDDAGAMLADPLDPRRRVYLDRFVDAESAEFLLRQFKELKGLTPAQRLASLRGDETKLTLKKEVALRLSAEPGLGYFDMRWKLFKNPPAGVKLKEKELATLWAQINPKAMSLNDRAYVARTHPMALWLLPYLAQHPQATYAQALADSRDARFAAYEWLYKKAGRVKQEHAIMTVLERDAFKQILPYWRRQGFPFNYMTPSYASALGSSCDRPLALAELMGALLNDGERLPVERVSELRFGKGTPFETIMEPRRDEVRRLMSPEVSAVVRKATLSVVEGGTAVRLRGAFKRADGTPIPLYAKTGTGDNRLNVYGPGGRLIVSQAKSRTATLVFAIGERFFGTITAYVKPEEDEALGQKPSHDVDAFSFTSVLVSQTMKSLVPLLEKNVLAAEDPYYLTVSH